MSVVAGAIVPHLKGRGGLDVPMSETSILLSSYAPIERFGDEFSRKGSPVR